MRLLLLSFLFPLSVFGGEYWGCRPQYAPKDDPKIFLAPGSKPHSMYMITEKDWQREGGLLPQGKYEGTVKASASGKFVRAEFNVNSYFPNPLSGGTDSILSFSLRNDASLFAVEAYLLYPEGDKVETGEILNNFVCRYRVRP